MKCQVFTVSQIRLWQARDSTNMNIILIYYAKQNVIYCIIPFLWSLRKFNGEK